MRLKMRTFLFLVLALIAVIPAAIFGLWPHTGVLEKEISEVSQRNLLVARNMSLSLAHYERNLRSLFRFFARASIGGVDAFEDSDALEIFHFRHICIARNDDASVVHNALSRHAPCPAEIPAARFETFRRLATTDQARYAPVMAGPDGQPTFYLVMVIGDYLAVGAVETDFLVELARSVVFGKRGHAAIVDSTGQVIAHPKPEWIAERRDLSALAPVQMMMAGKTGTTRFFSPAAEVEMIAGYTVVANAGWGIMVPVPMHELDDKIFDTKLFALGVLLVGLVVAWLLAWWLSGLTSRPLATVAVAARSMSEGTRGVRVAAPARPFLLESAELAQAFNAMADSVEAAITAESEAHADSDAILGASPAAIFLLDQRCRFRLINRRFEEWFDCTTADVQGRRPQEVFPLDLANRLEDSAEALAKVGEARELEISAELADGESRSFRAHMFPIPDADGTTRGVGAILVDETRNKLVEESLRQAQKMEAVGQLTGGIAHDFNNLLAITKGHGELLKSRLSDSDPHIGAILRAAERGSELTQRLLAFSRRQPLQPRAVDVGALLDEMRGLIETSLGETIEISYGLDRQCWPAKVDPGQLENAILNLALNARDAMASGGKFVVETRNAVFEEIEATAEIEPGDYVLLEVTDSGHGMAGDVLEHAFEPFFTTKDVGAGSGLGLSTVYGFARQSGGLVTLESAPGRGTVVRLYLPRAMARASTDETQAGDFAPPGQGERILVIEDNPDVLDLVVAMLESLNYVVEAEADARAARAWLGAGGEVDLILSDVVLPGGVSGLDLALAERRRDPFLRFVFMSGYPASADDEALEESGIQMLRKPFERAELARALRFALAGDLAAE